MEAVLDLIAQGKLPVEKLTSHRFPIARAAEAYDLITTGAPVLGAVIEYPVSPGGAAPSASTLARRRVVGGARACRWWARATTPG
jgi:hypothetical protein